MKNQKLILLFAVFSLAACAKSHAPAKDRTEVEKLDEVSPLTTKEIENPLLTTKMTACQALAFFKKDEDAGPMFSMVHHMVVKPGGAPELTGAIELSDFPIARMALPTRFNISDDEFLAQAEKEYSGNDDISRGILIGLRGVYATRNVLPAFSLAKVLGLNQKATELFPGVFGKSGSMNKSITMLLLSKVKPEAAILAAGDILSSRSPLFLSDDWSSFPEDVRNTFGAAIYGFSLPDDSLANKRERICALSLMHRGFAQLLSIKGYQGVEILAGDDVHTRSRAESLTVLKTQFKITENPGVFVNAENSGNVVLDEKDILSYKPTVSHHLAVSKSPRSHRGASAIGGLRETLEVLEGAVYAFQATSPSAPWVKKDADYLFGDITDIKSAAIVPAEAHGLSLGLINVLLKNISLLHIQRITSSGLKVKSGDTPAGIMLSEVTPAPTVTVDLHDVLSLTRIMVYLDNSLALLSKLDADSLLKRQVMYNRKTLAMLVGTQKFTKEELKVLLTDEEAGSVLTDQLKLMRLPLAMLLTKFKSKDVCTAGLSWNTNTGAVEQTAGCNQTMQKEFQETLKLLSQYAKSTILL